jgi:hypothetical protein
VHFLSSSNWLYVLERAEDFVSWIPVSTLTPGTGNNLLLLDPNPPPDKAFYRVSAQRP